jgi:hypothetical protein
MSAGSIDAAMVASAAFALATMGRRDPSDADIGHIADSFGADALAIARRLQAELIEEEAVALETWGAIRTAKAGTA